MFKHKSQGLLIITPRTICGDKRDFRSFDFHRRLSHHLTLLLKMDLQKAIDFLRGEISRLQRVVASLEEPRDGAAGAPSEKKRGGRKSMSLERRCDRGGRRSKRNGAEENSERRRGAWRLGEVEVGLDLYAGRYCGRLETPLRKRT
jgi:hypothetical protein